MTWKNSLADYKKFVNPDFSPDGLYAGWPLVRMAVILDMKLSRFLELNLDN